MAPLAQKYLICLCFVGALIPVVSQAEIDFFHVPAAPKLSAANGSVKNSRESKIAKVLFFIAPGCSTCPDEAARMERELTRLGVKYQMEGVFVGEALRLGQYLAALRTYPFKFETALDVDAKIANQHGIKTFPTTVIELNGKKLIITKPEDLEANLK